MTGALTGDTSRWSARHC